MSIKLVVEGKPPIELDGEEIFLGSDPTCTVAFCDALSVKPNHAVIRLVDERWIIEVLQAETIIVGGTKPKKAHWLTPGDVICLTDDGPKFTFDPPVPVTQPAARPKAAKTSDVVLLPEDDDPVAAQAPDPRSKSSAQIPVTRSQSSASLPASKSAPAPKSATVKTVKPSSSAIIQVPKKTSSPSAEITKPPASKTMKTVAPPSTATLKTTSTFPESTSNKKSSDKIPRSGSDSKSSDVIARRSSSQIKVPKSEPAEREQSVPVLKRITSYEMPIPPEIAGDEAADDWDPESGGRRRRRKPDADMQFIKTVVIWCASIGVGILILYIGLRELINATKAPKVGVSTSLVVPHAGSDQQKIVVRKRSNRVPRTNAFAKSQQPLDKKSTAETPDLYALASSMGSILSYIDNSLIERKLPPYQ